MIVAAVRGRDRPRPDRRDVPPPTADRRRRDASSGAATDERRPPSAGWSSPSRSTGMLIVIALGWKRCRAARPAGSQRRDRPRVPELDRRADRPARTATRRTRARSSPSLFDYVEHRGVNVELGICVDPLSVFMCLVVSGVSFLIHLYSIAYMTSDRGYTRYFAYLNYFVFSMLLLVLAGNFVLLIVGWAFVGAASYLLISFWYRRERPPRRRHQGVRDQRDRRHRAGDRRLPAVQQDRRARLPGRLRTADERLHDRTTARSSRSAC